MKVVAKKYFLNQTAALAPTGVFTSTEGGDYLVNLSVAYATAELFDTTISWVDSFSTSKSVDGGGNPITVAANLLPGGTISVSTDVGGTPGTYSLYVTVVDLSAPSL